MTILLNQVSCFRGFSNAGTSRLKSENFHNWLRSQNMIYIFQKPTPRVSKETLQIFQTPAFHASMPPTVVCNFLFKKCLWRYQNFQIRRFAPEYQLFHSFFFKSWRFAPPKPCLLFVVFAEKSTLWYSERVSSGMAAGVFKCRFKTCSYRWTRMYLGHYIIHSSLCVF